MQHFRNNNKRVKSNHKTINLRFTMFMQMGSDLQIGSRWRGDHDYILRIQVPRRVRHLRILERPPWEEARTSYIRCGAARRWTWWQKRFKGEAWPDLHGAHPILRVASPRDCWERSSVDKLPLASSAYFEPSGLGHESYLPQHFWV